VRDSHTYVSIKEDAADAAIAAPRQEIGEREVVVERAKDSCSPSRGPPPYLITADHTWQLH